MALWSVGLPVVVAFVAPAHLQRAAPPLLSTTFRNQLERCALLSAQDDGCSLPKSGLASVLDTANGLTKWIVVAAQTTAVVTRRDFASPYIVVGSIGASFAAHALKKVINQERPDGSPFIDPGMPSSHALVATFAASAWAVHLQRASATFTPAVGSGRERLARHAGCHVGADPRRHRHRRHRRRRVDGAGRGERTDADWRGEQVPSPPCAIYLGGSVAFVVKKMDKWDWRK